MTKLASTLAGKGRDELESFVAQGDTSVPGIEMSDLNDGDILSRTREQVNSSGLFQFVYIPEDGSDNIVSDWVDQEHKKKLVRQWVDGVKAAIIGRSQEKMQAAKDAALEERARKIRQEQMDDETTDTEVEATTQRGSPAARVERNSGRLVTASDPSDYVNANLDEARERLRAAEETQQFAIREVLEARKALAKWTALASALEGSDTVLAYGDSGETRVPAVSRNSRIQIATK